MALPADAIPRVRILLSTYNGAAFLPEQLDSFLQQDFADWTLWWRDDFSRDASPDLLHAFAPERCVPIAGSPENVGVLRSYMTLLRAASADLRTADAIAFADQDDVWLPDKLARGMAALRGASGPALYCTRLRLVDAELRPIGLSVPWRRPGGFPQSLTQNIATGCTIMLNRDAARLIAGSTPPAGTLHDWWSYLLVSAAGGTLLRDEEPSVLYRQHGANTVGVAPSRPARALAAMRRGPRAFMDLFRAHVASLLATPDVLAATSRESLLRIETALRGGPLRRLLLLSDLPLERQTMLETAMFAVWFLRG